MLGSADALTDVKTVTLLNLTFDKDARRFDVAQCA
jgi:hypothetical protein